MNSKKDSRIQKPEDWKHSKCVNWKENEKKEKARIKKIENMTNDVCFYGLWQSASEIDEGLGRSSTDNAKRQALESQLKFRKNVF
jgi:hypothetical protein